MMADSKSEFKEIVKAAAEAFFAEKGVEMEAGLTDKIVVQNAPDPAMGDLGSPMFAFAKALRMAPPQIAAGVAELAAEKAKEKGLGQVLAVGPYVNIKLDKAGAAFPILSAISSQGKNYGSLL